MELCAILTKEELAQVAAELLPLDVEISRRPRRQISLGRAERVELVAGSGLRLAGKASMVWEIASLPVSLAVRRWQVMLSPRVVATPDGLSLAFEPSLECLDFRRIPGFVDDRVIAIVNEILTGQKSKLVWRFEKTLSVRKSTSGKFRPRKHFAIAPEGATVDVTSSRILLSIRLRARVESVEEVKPSEALVPTSRT